MLRALHTISSQPRWSPRLSQNRRQFSRLSYFPGHCRSCAPRGRPLQLMYKQPAINIQYTKCNVQPEPRQLQQLLPSPGDAPTHPLHSDYTGLRVVRCRQRLAGPWFFSWLVLFDLCLHYCLVVEIVFRDPFSFVYRKSRPCDEKFPNTPPPTPYRTPAQNAFDRISGTVIDFNTLAGELRRDSSRTTAGTVSGANCETQDEPAIGAGSSNL